jgi:hypothetical protein
MTASSTGPLGNKSVRVEDFITIQSGSAGGVGTSAVNTITVNASGGVVPQGAYFTLSSPEPLEQETQNPVQRYHTWYFKGSAVDPLPKESNNLGIKVIIASGQNTDVVASNTVVAIESFFSTRPPAISVSATRSGNDVVLTNRTTGPAQVEDGTGTRGTAAIAASTGFTFASTTPGVRPDRISFTLASTVEASGATGASILTLIPFVTTSGISTASSFVVNAGEVIEVRHPQGDNFPVTEQGISWQLRTPGESFFVWYAASSVVTEPLTTSGTGIRIDVSTVSTSAQVATRAASAINAVNNFSATASNEAVTITMASSGNAPASEDIDASVAIAVIDTGGISASGSFSIIRSNRFTNPDFD